MRGRVANRPRFIYSSFPRSLPAWPCFLFPRLQVTNQDHFLKKGWIIKDQDEIDIVGLYAEDKKALVAEVKKISKNSKSDLFALKVEELRKKVLLKYEIESRLFSMEDM